MPDQPATPSTDAPEGPLRPGEIRFVDACIPPLAAGDYRASIRQVVCDAARPGIALHAKPYETTLRFVVDAPRFKLQPTDLHSVYPPAGDEGQFGGTVPHVVFTRRTLPWERGLAEAPTAGHGAAPGSPGQTALAPPPWMALLVLSDVELQAEQLPDGTPAFKPLPVLLASEVQTPVDSLLQPLSALTRPPALGQARWDEAQRRRYAASSCQVLDLTLARFRAIAPRLADLPYLAHARQVCTDEKEVFGINDQGWFSVLLANRFVRDGGRYHAVLVSLEGHEELLSEDDAGQGPSATAQPPGLPPTADRQVLVQRLLWLLRQVERMKRQAPRLRLVVLGRWSFTCHGEGGNFKSRMAALNRRREAGSAADAAPEWWLRMPASAPDADTSNKEHAIVEAALAQGYTPFGHAMRHGERTVSWYRGPLVPLINRQPQGVQQAVRCADELLTCDPRTGMMEVTYAAAWQLGRLLALQNHAFAQALGRARWRLREDEQRQLDAAPDLAAASATRRQLSTEDELVAYLHGPGGATLIQAMAPDWVTSAAHPSTGDASAACARPEAEEELPGLGDAAGWLARLALLYGVPLHYLVPCEDLLPPESLRFFYLDPFWVQYLLRGACSIGDTGIGRGFIDAAMNGLLAPAPSSGSIASAAVDVREGLRRTREGLGAEPRPGMLHWPLSGFLMRSSVVAGWKGLEIAGCGSAERQDPSHPQASKPLQALRIEQLCEDVMLGLFNGSLKSLVIRQPKEGLHFGLQLEPGSGTAFKQLRRPAALAAGAGDGAPSQAATADAPQLVLSDAFLQSAPHKGDASVMRLAALAGAMQARLNPAPPAAQAALLGAGEFAVQMIEAAGAFTFLVPEGPA